MPSNGHSAIRQLDENDRVSQFTFGLNAMQNIQFLLYQISHSSNSFLSHHSVFTSRVVASMHGIPMVDSVGARRPWFRENSDN